MADAQNQHRSRRSLLAAAAGGAAALAAQAALPLTAAAANGGPVVIGAANTGTSPTTLTNTTAASTGFSVTATGAAFAVDAFSPGAAGVRGVSTDGTEAAGAEQTPYTGVYGWAPAPADPESFGTGLWGDSPDVGVFATSSATGVYALGYYGVLGEGTVGVIGQATGTVGPGVRALGMTTSSPALQVIGKVSFNRSGRKQIGAGATSVAVTLAGVTTSSKVFAVLATNRSGRYVRAVVPAAGKFTIYLNASYTSASYISWFVLD